MKSAYRLLILLALPLVFAGAGVLTAQIATMAAKLVAPDPVDLIDATATGNIEEIFRMISAGQDPGQSTILDRPVFHWRPGDVTSPLLVAIAADSTLSEITYLVRETRHLSDPPNDQVLCLAARYGHTNVAEFFIKMVVPAVPKDGCDEKMLPEEIAKRNGSDGLSKIMRQYRLDSLNKAEDLGHGN